MISFNACQPIAIQLLSLHFICSLLQYLYFAYFLFVTAQELNLSKSDSINQSYLR